MKHYRHNVIPKRVREWRRSVEKDVRENKPRGRREHRLKGKEDKWTAADMAKTLAGCNTPEED